MGFISRALDIISAPLSQPKTFLTKGWGAAAKKVKKTRKEIELGKASGLKVIGTTLATTAIAAGAIYAGGAAVAAAKAGTLKAFAGKAAIKLVPKTLKGKILGGTAAVMGTGMLIESPKARKFAKETAIGLPEKVGDIMAMGGEVGKVVEGEKEFVTDDIKKGLKTAGVLGGVVAAGTLVAPKVVDWWKSRDKEGVVPPTLSTEKETLIGEAPLGIPGEVPILPETTEITPPKRRYKRRTATKTPPVRQSVRVNVIANPKATGIKISNRKYINPCLLN